MTREEKRIAIAVDQRIPMHARFYAMNHGGMQYWNYRSREDADRLWKLFGDEENPVEDFWMVEWLPDYFGCLNACHKMETKLTIKETGEYLLCLARVTRGSLSHWDYMKAALVVHAAPFQRAEAYGLARGLWTEND